MRTLVLALHSAAILLHVANPAAADCVAEAAEGLPIGDPIVVLATNGQRFGGILRAVNPEDRLLLLTSESVTTGAGREIPYDLVRGFEYRAKGKVHGSYAFWGLLLGAAAGFLVGQSVDSGTDPGSDAGGGVVGAAIGAGAGLVAGAGLSLAVPTDRSVLCEGEEP